MMQSIIVLRDIIVISRTNYLWPGKGYKHANYNQVDLDDSIDR